MIGAFFMGGLYVAGALGAIALILMKFFNIGNPNLWDIMGNRAWEGTTNFILIAIPLFILMGELVLRSGIAERMYNVLSRWLVFIPGGLIHSNIASCAVFAGVHAPAKRGDNLSSRKPRLIAPKRKIALPGTCLRKDDVIADTGLAGG